MTKNEPLRIDRQTSERPSNTKKGKRGGFHPRFTTPKNVLNNNLTRVRRIYHLRVVWHHSSIVPLICRSFEYAIPENCPNICLFEILLDIRSFDGDVKI